MKKLLIATIILVINISINAQFSKPKISALSTEFNFGDVKEGEILTHNFVIQIQAEKFLKFPKLRLHADVLRQNL